MKKIPNSEGPRPAGKRFRPKTLQAGEWVEGLIDPAPGPVELAEAGELKERVVSFLQGWPDRDAAALVLGYLTDKRGFERCLRALREEIADD